MKLFDAIFRQIQAKNKTKNKFRLLREKIDDSAYSEDLISQSYERYGRDLLNDVLQHYKDYVHSDQTNSKFHFIKQNGITGFAIDAYKFDLEISDWRLLQLHCLNCLKQQHYIVHLNQLETKKNGDDLLTSYKYYLKPSIKLMTTIPSEQLYGNISIELILQNDDVFRFLLQANYYSDRNYKKEKKFSTLLESF